MKRIFLSGVCASILAVSGCSETPQPPQTETAKPAQTAVAVNQALSSGIDFANFDKSVRPQDNFYRYVNGTWLKNTTMPADKTSIGAFYDLREESQEDVKAIIEELAATDNLAAGSDEQKVADLYRSYMDTDTIEKLGLTPIKPMLNEIDQIKNDDDLMQFFAESQIAGAGTPLAFYIEVDAKDSSRYATHIWQYGLSLPDRDYYLNEDERFVNIRSAYLAHIEKMFSLAGLANAKQAAQTVMNIETGLAKAHWTRVESRDSQKRYNKYQVNDLPQLADQVNWQAYLAALGVADQPDIIINQPSYIEGFNNLLKTVSIDDWKTYATWHTLTAYASLLNADLADENFDFFARTLNGQQEQKPRWKRGVDRVNSVLGEVVGKIYVSKHFKPEAKARMSELVENLRNAYGASIDDLDWMGDETKGKAKAKLAAFTPKIGYPDRWEDYSDLTIKADALVANTMAASRVQHAKELEKLAGPIRKWEWHMNPQTVNAYYNPTMNEIVFPAAILQPPFFNMAADDAVNYGGIGAVIGHEMGHGFDDQGARYDGDGNLKNWWTEDDLKAFGKRTKQLVDQFNGYYVFDDLHVNGELTLGENIGDLSGITIAYKAYKMSLNGKEAPVIDGLTGDQRFFIGFTQIWRGMYQEQALRNRVATDPHSPGEFRALGSLSNTPEFYKAFDVKEGDAMYLPPEKRVKIW
ncbi:M13 family metallopeptidase [Paraferrimonas haliotis]|uniref:Peptidase M13 n=1 Tax=Paraferrimonas haliotis TaxID=2013866 RepID=A0AA37WXX7_9GAMM|nr:M13-type metalloendopeptidase [Paraferrimonas haliotis]GLS83090.1 peptidase M13 [Paraferrimonas haliotis]